MTIAERFKDIVIENLDVDEDEVTPEASFTDDLGADSLDIVELSMAVEEAFDFEIDENEDDDYGRISTVGQAVAYIEARVSKQSA